MNSIEVYRTKKKYKIVTLYKLESGSYISSEPIYILPLDAGKKEITSKFFEALNSSRNLSKSEEDNFWLGNKILKKIKEPSFDRLYSSSTSCNVTVKKDLAVISPQKYVGKGRGLEIEENQALKVPYNGNNKAEIATKIIKLLESSSAWIIQ